MAHVSGVVYNWCVNKINVCDYCLVFLIPHSQPLFSYADQTIPVRGSEGVLGSSTVTTWTWTIDI